MKVSFILVTKLHICSIWSPCSIAYCILWVFILLNRHVLVQWKLHCFHEGLFSPTHSYDSTPLTAACIGFLQEQGLYFAFQTILPLAATLVTSRNALEKWKCSLSLLKFHFSNPDEAADARNLSFLLRRTSQSQNLIQEDLLSENHLVRVHSVSRFLVPHALKTSFCQK